MPVLLNVANLKKYFSVEHGILKSSHDIARAVDGVSFKVEDRDTFGIVGESGSGKTTLAKMLLSIIKLSSGSITFNKDEIKNFRKDVQIIFQNPYNSLNPIMKIKDILAEPLIIHKLCKKRFIIDKVLGMLNSVGLEPNILVRRPIEFSGGQRQRISIARALLVQPRILILDEPVSSLDLTIQSQILALLERLKRKFNLTLIFISHNLKIISRISNVTMVMYLGKIMEIASTDAVYNNYMHPYTEGLINTLRTYKSNLKGEIPSNINPPSGCVFRTRCPYAKDICSRETPRLEEKRPQQFSACLFNLF